MTRRTWAIACMAALVSVTAARARAAEGAPSEQQKIEQLIKAVEKLPNAQFVRNGRAYDGQTAAKFLRGKRDYHQSQARTARDFIKNLASKSSTTGKPYVIRYRDGKEVKSAEFLTTELDKIEQP